LGLSFRGAYMNKWGMDYSGERISLSSRISADIGRGLVNIICEILFSGPALLMTSIECAGKFLRLQRLLRKDLVEVAGLFLWLFDKGRKATVQEISAKFPVGDTIRILPLMRDIPGVIWLTYHHGVIILSSELRNRLAATLNQSLPFRGPEFEPAVEDEPSISRDYSGSAEAVEWYKALDLPPFAPLTTVKRRYRQMAKICHPDTAAGGKTDAS
jgi:hypothetical protein